MSFLLNIGNTRIQVGFDKEGGISYFDTESVRTKDDFAQILSLADADTEIFASCVVPRLRQLAEDAFGGRIHFISVADYPMLDFCRYDVSTLGADRIANAAAAFCLFGGPIAVIDCGTAINTEVVDANGVFLGGVIMPGRALARRALAHGTAQLPSLKKGMEMPPILGVNTAEAIAAGVDRSCVAGLRQFVFDVRRMPGMENCRIIITGGDAGFFQPLLDNVDFAPDFLTLRGIALNAHNRSVRC